MSLIIMDFDKNLGLIFFALGLIFFSTFCLAFARVVKLHRFAPEWQQSKLLYISLLLHTGLRTGFFAIICPSVTDLTAESFFVMMSIPDITFIVCYLFFTWQYMSVFYYSHFEAVIEESLLAQANKKPLQSSAARFGVFFLILWIGLQSTLFLAMAVERFKMAEMSKELGIANIIIPTLVLGLMFTLQLKFSGSPNRSEEWRQRLVKISAVTVAWSLTRYFKGIVSLIHGYSISSLAEHFDNHSKIEFGAVLVLICELIVCEVMCIFFVLDYGFVNIFMHKSSSNPTIESQNSSESVRKNSDEFKVNKFAYIPINRSLKEEELKLGQALSLKKHAFGELFNASYKKNPVVLRKVTFSRLSGYVLEEISDEFQRLASLDIDNLLPLVGVYIQSPVLGVIHPLMANGSLNNVLHVVKPKMSFNDKVRIGRQVAHCMTELHHLGLYHGHLTSHNILMDEELNAYVGDLGLHKAKKYAGLMFGYSNKSAWSSPEQLRERSLTANTTTASDDVYSFGVILWEMMSGEVPFGNLNKKQLKQNVVVENYRPPMPHGLPEPLVELIAMCWNKTASGRPSFEFIEKVLSPDYGIVN